MDNEGPIHTLIDDCVLELFRVMNIASLLAFGCTNTRFRAMVHNFIALRQQQEGNIRFVLNGSFNVMSEIMLRFGENFVILCVEFGSNTIDMGIFQDESEGCMLNNCHELTLRAYTNERMAFHSVDDDDDSDNDFDPSDYEVDNYYNIGDSITPMLEQFRLNAENIVNTINNDEIPTLRRLIFHFSFVLTPSTLNRYLSWRPQINPIVNAIMNGWRRGNLSYNYVLRLHGVELIFEFDL